MAISLCFGKKPRKWECKNCGKIFHLLVNNACSHCGSTKIKELRT